MKKIKTLIQKLMIDKYKNFVSARTPFRISFFGGGSDFPKYYNIHKGEVLSCAIDKYCYLHIKKLHPFFKYNFRICYSKIELKKNINQIKHPTVKNVLNFLKAKNEKLEIFHQSDLPSMSGSGSSSAFTVGLLNSLSVYLNKPYKSKKKLALDAIHVEQKLNKELVGSQDQMAVANGGINHILFSKNKISLNKINLNNNLQSRFLDHLVMVNTVSKRLSFEIVSSYKFNDKYLNQMKKLAREGKNILINGKNFLNFGELLNESWFLKKKLSNEISNYKIDNIYKSALKSGAIGGKLMGAGKNGCLIFFVENKKKFVEKFFSENKLSHIPFEIDKDGTKIIYRK